VAELGCYRSWVVLRSVGFLLRLKPWASSLHLCEVETIRYFAEFVDPQIEIAAVEADPDDDKFIEAAVAGEVAYLVSGDRHLLTLDSFRDVDIVTPRVFYDQLVGK